MVSQEQENAKSVFKPVSSRVSFPLIEERILAFWNDHDIVDKVDQVRKDAPLFTLYEGPPTANGTPGIHHVLARVFKDIIPRFKTMRGYRAVRKGGWDTHGLPVELEIEKELGTSSKREIEDLVPGDVQASIQRFNDLCRTSVMRYVQEWEDLTNRIAFWVDMPNAYVTFRNEYIETGWWILKTLWDRGLLYQGYRVAPHCPRCVTTLSSHEVALGYKDDTPDPSIFVRFPLKPEQPNNGLVDSKVLAWDRQENIPSLLAWTTTPWTLTANVALAVAPNEAYSLVRSPSEQIHELLIIASERVETVLGPGWEEVASFTGEQLVGLSYEPPYHTADSSYMHQVVTADYVSMDDGTGIVHTAPAYGAEDQELGREWKLPTLHTVDMQGRIKQDTNLPFAGSFVKDADEPIIHDLMERGLLYKSEVIKHTYPFCWRCDSPLLYYAKSSWYLRTTAVQQRLISGNQEINWYPHYIKDGRFGEWLRNNIDWALSRERYWGTPLPIWRCESCSEYTCIGSIAELHERAEPASQQALTEDTLDLHRPHVDQILITCDKCRGTMQRIPDVADAWFDSGAMPFAQAHVMSYDHLEALREAHLFPADYICEAVDQTRGWFYTLHALSTLIAGEPSYKNVICLGLIMDGDGYKMSKSRGNVVNPWEVVNERGADAIRWYMYTSGPPGSPRRFSAELVGESVRKFLLTLWNVYSFFVTYANLDEFDPNDVESTTSVHDLDRWILSELHQLILEVTQLLEEYNPTDAGRRIEEFVDSLSNRYVRRSRPRFWKPVLNRNSDPDTSEHTESDEDKLSAHRTLYTCLSTLARLLAPFTPFVADEMYQNLVRSVDADAPESVHLDDWPIGNETLVDRDLSDGMRLTMRVASMGRAARSKAGIRVRQPLGKILVKVRSPQEFTAMIRLSSQVTDELNVQTIEELENEETVARFSVRANTKLLGPKYGSDLPKIEQALQRANPAVVAELIGRGESVDLEGVILEPQEVNVSLEGLPGYAVIAEGGYTVALDLTLTADLVDEGVARELIHRIQNMRRAADFDIADRITTWCQGDDDILRVLQRHEGYIRQETLTAELQVGEPDENAFTEENKIDGKPVKLAVKKVS